MTDQRQTRNARRGEAIVGVDYSHYLIPRDNTVRPDPDRIVALIDAWIEKGFVVRPESVLAQDQRTSNGRRSETGARFMTRPLHAEALKPEPAPPPRKGFWSRFWGGAQKPPPADPWMPFRIPPVGESLSALANPCTLIRWEGHPSAIYPLQTVAEFSSQGERGLPHSLVIEVSDDFANPNTDPYGVGVDTKQVNPSCSCGCNLEYEDTMGWLTVEKIRRVCPACRRAFRPQDQVAEIVDANGAKTRQAGGLCNRFAITIAFGKQMPLYVRNSAGELTEATPKVTGLFLDTCSAALGIELNEFSYYS
jgi:hypothetical protein